MDDEPIVISSGLVISPEAVVNRSFTSAFRGYNPAEVKQFLKRVADEMAAAAAREVELRRALQDALSRAAHPQLDEGMLTTGLGEHAARLIASARETAATIAADAEKRATGMLRDAEARIAHMRQDAESLLARRVDEANTAASGILQAAEAEAHALREQARAEAQAAVETARAQGKEMVAEARALRERMLGDLARRRRQAQLQVEQLRAARERLLAAYEVVRRTAEEATQELTAAEPEARMAAEAVARRAVESDIPARPGPAAPHGPPSASGWPPEPPPPLAPVRGDAAGAAAAQTRPSHPSHPSHPSRPLAPPADDRPAASAPGPTGRPGGPGAERRRVPVPVAVAAPRLSSSAVPTAPRLRPQTVTEAVGRRAGADLGTGETPAVAPAPARPANVEALFARIRADRAHTLAEPPPSTEPAETNGNDNGAAATPPGAGAAEPPSEVVPPAADAAAGPGPEAAPSVAAEAPAPADDTVVVESAMAARDRLLEPLEAGLARSVKRVLQDEHNALLDALRRRRPPSPEAALPPVAEQTASYREAALPWLQRAAAGGAGRKVDAPSVDALATALADELVRPLRERLTRALASSDDGDDPGGAGESLRSCYRQSRGEHLDESVRHHVAAAWARGSYAGAPERAQLRWVVDSDGHCPDCDDNALAGATAKGEPYPTGQLHPPAHAGCRCLLIAAST